jgi:hypothetical protein
MTKNKDASLHKFISTIMMRLYDEDILNDGFILRWDENAIKGLEQHFLYLKERDEVFKIHCKDFLNWLKQ